MVQLELLNSPESIGCPENDFNHSAFSTICSPDFDIDLRSLPSLCSHGRIALRASNTVAATDRPPRLRPRPFILPPSHSNVVSVRQEEQTASERSSPSHSRCSYLRRLEKRFSSTATTKRSPHQRSNPDPREQCLPLHRWCKHSKPRAWTGSQRWRGARSIGMSAARILCSDHRHQALLLRRS